MQLGDDARIEEHDDAVIREVNGEAVLLHLLTERYFVLDAPSTRMFHALVEAPTFAEAIRALVTEFDVEEDVLRRDLERFVGELVEQGLATVDDAR